MRPLLFLILIIASSRSFGAGTCEPIPNGKRVAVNRHEVLNSRYEIIRTDNSYRAVVYPTLVNEKGEPLAAELANQYINHFNKCFEFIGDVKTYGREFANQKISVRIGQANTRPSDIEEVKVSMMPPGSIKYLKSVIWTSDIKCEVLVHEVYHLLGLVDLYGETRENSGDPDIQAFDCRSKATQMSLMSDRDMLNESLPSYIPISCICENSQCRAKLSEIDKTGVCPGELLKFDAINRANLFNRNINMSEFYTEPGTWRHTSPYIATSVIVEQPKQNWQIHPSEFRMIVQPNCSTGNIAYNTCSQNSYRTTVENGGSGCLQLPDFCNRYETWLGEQTFMPASSTAQTSTSQGNATLEN